jgi:hypothetical protein
MKAQAEEPTKKKLTFIGALERYVIPSSPRKISLSSATTVLAQAIDTISATAAIAPPCNAPKIFCKPHQKNIF